MANARARQDRQLNRAYVYEEDEHSSTVRWPPLARIAVYWVSRRVQKVLKHDDLTFGKGDFGRIRLGDRITTKETSFVGAHTRMLCRGHSYEGRSDRHRQIGTKRVTMAAYSWCWAPMEGCYRDTAAVSKTAREVL